MYKHTFTYRIISLSLVCLILMTSFDFSVNVHFCQDNFAGLSFSDGTNTCSSKKSSCSAKKKISSSEEDPNCCENRKFHFEDLDEDYNTPMLVDLFDQKIDLETPVSTFVLSYNNYSNEVISYTSYRPPPPDIDYQIQYQVFLI